MRKEAGLRGASVQAEEEEERGQAGQGEVVAAVQEEMGRRGEGRGYFGYGEDWWRSPVGSVGWCKGSRGESGGNNEEERLCL